MGRRGFLAALLAVPAAAVAWSKAAKLAPFVNVNPSMRLYIFNQRLGLEVIQIETQPGIDVEIVEMVEVDSHR